MASILNRYHRARRSWRRMDRLVRLIIAKGIIGMAFGALCALAILAVDVAGLRSLLWSSDMPVAGALMLTALFALTFGGVYCAAAVMMAEDDDEPPRGGRRLRAEPPPQLAYARVGARRRR